MNSRLGSAVHDHPTRHTFFSVLKASGNSASNRLDPQFDFIFRQPQGKLPVGLGPGLFGGSPNEVAAFQADVLRGRTASAGQLETTRITHPQNRRQFESRGRLSTPSYPID